MQIPPQKQRGRQHPFKAGQRPTGGRTHSLRGNDTVIADHSIVIKLRLAAFVPQRLEIPLDNASFIHTLREDKCCRCGGNASRAEYRLDKKEPYRFCWACR